MRELVSFAIGAVLVLLVLYRRERLIRSHALTMSRAVMRGQVSEQLAPLLPGFPYAAMDARFLGHPIDYVVFDGYGSNDEVEVVLVEVKTGRGKLSAGERRVRDAVEAGRVRFEVVRLD